VSPQAAVPTTPRVISRRRGKLSSVWETTLVLNRTIGSLEPGLTKTDCL
jgi:hypothetical protein